MPTILIFHGFGSNAKIAFSQTPNLRNALEKLGFTVEYVQAPIQLKPEDFPFEDINDCTKNPLFAWWHLKGTPDFKDTMELLASKYGENEMVFGVIGISQGGSLAGLVSANRTTVLPSLKFGMSFGGYLYPDPNWTEPRLDAYDQRINLHFLNVFGDDDEWVPPAVSKKLTDFGIGVDELVHHEGHSFADNDPALIEKAIDWIIHLT